MNFRNPVANAASLGVDWKTGGGQSLSGDYDISLELLFSCLCTVEMASWSTNWKTFIQVQ